MARDFAQRFNHLYGEHFVLPEAAIEEQVATLPGLDGRKMSKSYDNTIPLFAPREQLKKLIFAHRHRLARAGRAEGHRRLGAVPALPGVRERGRNRRDAPGVRRRHRLGRCQAEAVRTHRRGSRAAARDATRRWSRIRRRSKQQLRDGARRLRDALCDGALAGAARGGGLARPRHARRGRRRAEGDIGRGSPSFKQYREADGKFYFKLVEGERVLLQSTGFDSPKDAGARVGVLKRGVFDEGATTSGIARRRHRPEDVHAALAALLAAEADKA